MSVPSLTKYTQKEWQLDMPFSNGRFYSLPKYLPGRVNVDDFVFFEYPSTMNASDYVVAITSADTTNPQHPVKTIGPFQHSVELPHVMLDAYATIFVIPKHNMNLPTYYSRLNRGSTYTIKEAPRRVPPGTKYEMHRHGMLTAGANSSKLAYF